MKNWDRPLSDEVERPQDALKRLESARAGDIRRLRGAESEWWRLLRKAFVMCLGLVALLLWYINGYSETGDYVSGRDRAGADEALELGGEPSVAEENHEL